MYRVGDSHDVKTKLKWCGGSGDRNDQLVVLLGAPVCSRLRTGPTSAVLPGDVIRSANHMSMFLDDEIK